MHPAVWLLLSLLGLTSTLVAQDSPPGSLGAPTAKYDKPFTGISGVRELSDGRVLVLDSRESSIQLIDLIAAKSKAIGRVGSGPGEYRLPVRLLALAGDSSAVEDMAGFRRLLIVTPDGAPGGSVPVPSLDNARNPEAADDQGRLYSYHLPASDDGRTVGELAHIVRWTPASGRSDTVAVLSARVVSSIPLSDRAGPTPPFSSSEQWAVARDGRVAVVSVDPYRVTFFEPDGAKVVGPLLRSDRVALSDGHKREWNARAQRLVPAVIRVQGGDLEARWMRAPFRAPTVWPKYLPPFLPKSVFFSPDGRLWILRTGPAGSPPTFDLINTTGSLASRVVLPRGTRLVGFGATSVYLARIDDDDLEYLERYRLPAH